MKTNILRRSFLLSLVILLISFIGFNSLPTYAQPQNRIALPSEWQGVAEGVIYGQRFRLPMFITISYPLRGENNPFNMTIGIGNNSGTQIGSCGLYSALTSNTYSGSVVLQYFSIGTDGRQIQARLTNNHTAEASAINIFEGPNVAAQNSPPVMQEVYKSLGSVGQYYFRQAQVQAQLDSNGLLVGEIVGSGAGLVDIFSTSDVRYQARFAAKRVK